MSLVLLFNSAITPIENVQSHKYINSTEHTEEIRFNSWGCSKKQIPVKTYRTNGILDMPYCKYCNRQIKFIQPEPETGKWIAIKRFGSNERHRCKEYYR